MNIITEVMLLQLLIFFIQFRCCIWVLTALHTSIRTNISAENEIPNHLCPRSMVRQVVIEIWSNFLHLTMHKNSTCLTNILCLCAQISTTAWVVWSLYHSYHPIPTQNIFNNNSMGNVSFFVINCCMDYILQLDGVL